jgi:hypothetical protein
MADSTQSQPIVEQKYPGISGKWRRRLAWLLPAVFAGYVLLQVADYAWFRTQLPVTFSNANWSGRWTTYDYFGLSGRIVVRLPDPLPENEEFKTEALVYYPIYSVWKTGRFVKMVFGGKFTPDSSISAGRSTNTIEHGGGGKMSFKGTVGDQVVEYSALINRDRSRIVGGYFSSSPPDAGSFWITNP